MITGYLLHHRPRNTGRRGCGVGVPINNRIEHQSWILHDNPEITSFGYIELVISISSITIRLSIIYRMPPVKSKNVRKHKAVIALRQIKDGALAEYLDKFDVIKGVLIWI